MLDLKAKSVLEIGLFTGTTTLALALLPDVENVVALGEVLHAAVPANPDADQMLVRYRALPRRL